MALTKRRGTPDAVYAVTTPDGATVELKADAEGHVRARDAAQDIELEALGLSAVEETRRKPADDKDGA